MLRATGRIEHQKSGAARHQHNGTNAAESAHTRSYRACLRSRNSNQEHGTVGADRLCRSRRRRSSNSWFPGFQINLYGFRYRFVYLVFVLCSYFTSAVPIIVFALLIFVLFALAGVVLLSLALRYRAGTARRQARRWVTTLNVWMTSFSAIFFLLFTLLLSIWVASAFRFALIGMAVGGILGVLGLTLTRWESRPEGLFYTPSRWLAFIIVFAIAARVLYGWWRATHPSSGGGGDQHWLITTSGMQLSLAIASGLIGYYLVYSIGVRSLLARYEQRRE